MCVLFVAYREHPNYPLIVAANRDEYHARPTQPLHAWERDSGETEAQIYAGKDLLAEGTWCGLTQSGRFAAVTNIREVPALGHRALGQRAVAHPAGEHRAGTQGRSRGHLVTDFLHSDKPTAAALNDLRTSADQYSGFNLLAADRQTFGYFSNCTATTEPVPELLPPGIYGISNGLLESNWPKVVQGKTRFAALLEQNPAAEQLFEFLADRTAAQDNELPDTNLGFEREHSPRFISSPHYGTRSSLVLLLDKDGTITFSERTFAPDGSSDGERRVRFSISAGG